jgi:hypothetical protein
MASSITARLAKKTLGFKTQSAIENTKLHTGQKTEKPSYQKKEQRANSITRKIVKKFWRVKGQTSI